MMKIETKLSLLSHERKINYSLDNIRLALDKIGNPQDKLKIIHVAGTNGKGTTSDFMAQYIEQMGYKVGVYSSPHLISYCERFKINGTEIAEEVLDAYYNQASRLEGASKLTEFEILTVIAFIYFSTVGVDYLILETGLGGRLDATNVANPIATVITTISFDHRDYLGNSLVEISKEKAGIIKATVPTYLLYSGLESLSIMKLIAKERTSSLSVFRSRSHDYLTTNRAFARNIVKSIFHKQSPTINSLKNPIKTRVKGRMHFFRQNPLILLDSAHNLEGIKTLSQKLRSTYKNLTIIYAATKRPDIKAILKDIKAVATNLYLCEFDNPRAYTVAEFKELRQAGNLEYVNKAELKELIQKVMNSKDTAYCITGSIYFLGEVYKLLEHLNLQGEKTPFATT